MTEDTGVSCRNLPKLEWSGVPDVVIASQGDSIDSFSGVGRSWKTCRIRHRGASQHSLVYEAFHLRGDLAGVRLLFRSRGNLGVVFGFLFRDFTLDSGVLAI